MTSNTIVLIPTFNRKDLLCHQVNSILSGKIQPKKIIICDDGSKNKIKKKDFPNFKKIEIIRNKKNKGLQASCLKLIKFVNSRYFAFLADDDIVLSNWLSSGESQLKKYKDACAFFSRSLVMQKKLNAPFNLNFLNKRKETFCLSGLKQIFQSGFHSNNIIYRTNPALKIYKNFLRKKNFSAYLDLIVQIVLLQKYKIIVSKKITAIHFRDTNNYSFGDKIKKIKEIKIIKKMHQKNIINNEVLNTTFDIIKFRSSLKYRFFVYLKNISATYNYFFYFILSRHKKVSFKNYNDNKNFLKRAVCTSLKN